MFRVVPPPIIRSANNCIYSICYLSEIQIPDVVDTVVYAPDDWWWYHPKHVEQFPDKINCVTLHLVRQILEYSYVARAHNVKYISYFLPVLMDQCSSKCSFLHREFTPVFVNIRVPLCHIFLFTVFKQAGLHVI
jgi:hypothetical protein